jgi:hypothetical protein
MQNINYNVLKMILDILYSLDSFQKIWNDFIIYYIII